MGKLLRSTGFINCQTRCPERESLAPSNVIKTLSSVWLSLLVEVVMWRNFRMVFGPKAACWGGGDVSRKLVNAFCKRWKVSHLVVWGERCVISRMHNQPLTRPNKAFLADRKQDPFKESSSLHVPGLKAFPELKIFITGLSFRCRDVYFQLQFSFCLLMRLGSPRVISSLNASNPHWVLKANSKINSCYVCTQMI